MLCQLVSSNRILTFLQYCVTSHIQAAYASFLWEMGDEDQDEASEETNIGPAPFHSQAMASATA